MEGKRVTAKQIVAEMNVDMERLAEKIAEATNNARPGAIIDQSEEPVRDAHAEFRQKTYQKALDLLEQKRVAMTDYPYFLDQGYDIGSGPTESFCGCLQRDSKGLE